MAIPVVIIPATRNNPIVIDRKERLFIKVFNPSILIGSDDREIGRYSTIDRPLLYGRYRPLSKKMRKMV